MRVAFVLLLCACSAPAPEPANDTGECDLSIWGRSAYLDDLLFVVDGSPKSAALVARTFEVMGKVLRASWTQGADPRAFDNPPWVHVEFIGDGRIVAPLDRARFIDWQPWKPDGGVAGGVDADLAARAALAPAPPRRGMGMINTLLAFVEAERERPSGFLRHGGSLRVVLLSAADDDSRVAPAIAYQQLSAALEAGGFHPEPSLMAVTAPCLGVDAPGAYLSSLLAQDRWPTTWDLCSDDRIGPFQSGIISDSFVSCMPEPVGGADACVVIDQIDTGEKLIEHRMPHCDGSAFPCFHLDRSLCQEGTVRVVVDRGADYLAPSGTVTRAACECR